MPLTTVDRLSEFRDGTAALTATEAAGVNKLLLPPGTYKCWISVPIAPTGTTPTCTATIQEASDGSTWAAASGDAPSVTLSPTAAGESSFWFRVSKRASAGVAANVTLVLTVTGTTPNFGKVSSGVVGGGAGTGGFNDQP